MKTTLLALTLAFTASVSAAPLTTEQSAKIHKYRNAVAVTMAKTDKSLASALCPARDNGCMLEAYKFIDNYKALVAKLHEADKQYYELINRK